MANRSRRNLNFEGMIAKGEMGGVDGFQAQTANGTAFWKGTGFNRQYNCDMPEVPAGSVWPAGRSNRSGE